MYEEIYIVIEFLYLAQAPIKMKAASEKSEAQPVPRRHSGKSNIRFFLNGISKTGKLPSNRNI